MPRITSAALALTFALSGLGPAGFDQIAYSPHGFDTITALSTVPLLVVRPITLPCMSCCTNRVAVTVVAPVTSAIGATVPG